MWRGKGNSIIAALIFNARERTPAGQIVEEGEKKGTKKKMKFSLALRVRERQRENNARSFSMTTSRIEMARKMATTPKGEIFEVSNFISLLSLLPLYPFTFALKTLCARHIVGKIIGKMVKKKKKFELSMSLLQ